MKRTVVIIMSGLLIAGWTLAGEHPEHPTAKETAKSAGKLDGKVFVGEIGKKGAEKGDKDQFIFKQGEFVSTACIAYGFNEAPYVATEKDGIVSFTSEPTNAEAEKMSWKGDVKDDEIKGTAVHQTKTGQTEYWFKGTLKTGAEAADQPAETPKKSEHPEHPEHPK